MCVSNMQSVHYILIVFTVVSGHVFCADADPGAHAAGSAPVACLYMRSVVTSCIDEHKLILRIQVIEFSLVHSGGFR